MSAGQLAGLVAVAIIYLVPAIVAVARMHPNYGSILVVNVFLGWTLVGWVVALAWAVSHVDEPLYDDDFDDID